MKRKKDKRNPGELYPLSLSLFELESDGKLKMDNKRSGIKYQIKAMPNNKPNNK